MATATASAIRPLIELHIVPDENSKYSPVVPASWGISEDLVELMRESEFANPHLLIVTGYEKHSSYGSDDTKHLVATQIHSVALTDPPKQYLSFSHVGQNVVAVFVVDIATSQQAARVTKWKNRPNGLEFDHVEATDSYEIQHWDSDEIWVIASDLKRVDVDKEMFAKEPPKALRALVRQFFRGSEFDECHFRKRTLISLALSVPVQIYGVFARLLTFLFAVFMLKPMQLRQLVALNPHDFGHGLGESLWYYKRSGRERGPVRWFTPPQLVIYAFIGAIAMLALSALPALWLYAFNTHTVEGESVTTPWTFETFLIHAVVLDSIAAVIITLIWLTFSDSGHRSYRRLVNWISSTKTYSNANAVGLYDRLQAQAAAAATTAQPNNIANSTIRLKFYDLKMKVCKPFARTT